MLLEGSVTRWRPETLRMQKLKLFITGFLNIECRYRGIPN